MGIIDPNIIAFLQNYRQAQQGSGCKVSEPIGSLLVASLCRSARTARALELDPGLAPVSPDTQAVAV